jgi:dolichyl-phosphate beta-glucosyltransferase
MLSVVIPCYNESGRLDQMEALIEAHASLGWEWIFVDDGSADDTAARLEAFRGRSGADVQVCRHDINRGKGAAVRTGMLAARRVCAGYVDADLAASPLQFLPFLDDVEIVEGRRLLVGIRLLTEKRLVRRSPFRHFLGRIYQTYLSNVTGLTVYDTQCGFKMLQTARAKAIFGDLQCHGFAFDAELILVAKWKYGMDIQEEPVAWEEKHQSRVRPWTAARMFADLLAIQRRCRRYRDDADPSEAP